ncbi:MAG: hypothetical protein IJP21_02990 [Clostridia bacterium]|nr:hypothetical protein [Clostridia bacterium]
MSEYKKPPIMLLFFNRPDSLKVVFEWVRKMEPEELFLVQDGAREGNADDPQKLEECRKVVENVDWDCKVYRNYSDINLTCDEREFSGISWCFEYVDRLIILEDDVLPADSFYGFCAELLEKHKDDERIQVISGFNRVGKYTETPYDYLYSYSSAGIGWATWKRVWDDVRTFKDLELLDDPSLVKYYESIISKYDFAPYRNIIGIARAVRNKDRAIGKVSSWEKLCGLSAIMQGRFNITPSVNMVKYIGITEDATHCQSDARLMTHKRRKVLTQPSYELSGELKHPPYVVRDRIFEEKDRNSLKSSRILLRLESAFLKMRYGRFDLIKKAISKRMKRKG